MDEQTKNRYCVCLKVMCSDDVLKPSSNFIDLKYIEEKFPNETKQIKEALHIKYEGI